MIITGKYQVRTNQIRSDQTTLSDHNSGRSLRVASSCERAMVTCSALVTSRDRGSTPVHHHSMRRRRFGLQCEYPLLLSFVAPYPALHYRNFLEPLVFLEHTHTHTRAHSQQAVIRMNCILLIYRLIIIIIILVIT